MPIQQKLLTSENILNSIVVQAVQIYQFVDSTDEDGILIETAVYTAVRNVGIPIDQSLLESIMQLAHSKLQKGKE